MGYFRWLCHRKWLVLFSLKFQRNNQQSALAIGFAKGKTGEKGCIFTALRDETTAYYDRAFSLKVWMPQGKRLVGLPISSYKVAAMLGPCLSLEAIYEMPSRTRLLLLSSINNQCWVFLKNSNMLFMSFCPIWLQVRKCRCVLRRWEVEYGRVALPQVSFLSFLRTVRFKGGCNQCFDRDESLWRYEG